MENKILIAVCLALFLTSCAVPAGPKIYTANEGDGTISVIDEASLKVIKTIKLDGMPHNVNVDPLGIYVYATNHEEEEADGHAMGHIPYLRIIDAKTNKLVRSVAMEKMAAHVVPSKSGRIVYVSREGGSTVVAVDVENGEIIRTYKTGFGPHGMVMSNDGKRLYVPNMKTEDVSIVDVTSDSVETINLELTDNKCETPVAMGITSDDKHSFVTCGKSFEVYKIDNVLKKPVAVVELERGEFPGPIQVPVHPDGKYLYVPDMYHGSVHKIDIEKFELIKSIESGKGAHGIAYSADGKRAYVTNTYEDTLSVIDLESESVITKLQIGSKPNGVAVTNGKNQGW